MKNELLRTTLWLQFVSYTDDYEVYTLYTGVVKPYNYNFHIPPYAS